MQNKFLIQYPRITEKSTRQSTANNQHTFVVDKAATKPEIKKLIKAIYKVDAEKVRIINLKPREIRLARFVGTKAGHKKALVTLKKGQKLDIIAQ